MRQTPRPCPKNQNRIAQTGLIKYSRTAIPALGPHGHSGLSGLRQTGNFLSREYDGCTILDVSAEISGLPLMMEELVYPAHPVMRKTV
jgi:hypothetical protein